LIIAEAGVNHNGDMELARQLIDAAAQAGADMVKFQTFSANRLVTLSANKAQYQSKSTDAAESQHAMLSRLELTRDMHLDLIAYCLKRRIRFFSTGFDTDSVDMLVALGIDRFKIPSGEITNLPYLRHVGKYGRPVILSTGMSQLDEVQSAVEILSQAGTSRTDITVLHCSTEYPTPMEDVNLRAMLTMGDALGVQVGYSDHTAGIEVAIAAVALGATVIEKHFTLNRELPGPDHKASLEPDELKAMVVAIRNIERAMGDGIKRPCQSEIPNMVVARKSIVAAQTIMPGEMYSEENLAVKRPGSGMSPMLWDSVIGKRATRAYEPDELIQP
jgi:N,N'-diacetyllegionaminate synthase